MPVQSDNKRKKSDEEIDEKIDEQMSDDSSSSFESEDDEEMDEAENLEADFEAHEPFPEDQEGIKALLKQLFKKEPIELGQLADHLIKEKFLCTVIKQLTDDEMVEDDDEDVFSLTAFLELNKAGLIDKPFIKLIKGFLLRTAKERNNNEIVNLLEDKEKSTVLVLNERFINLPSKVGLMSLQNLLEEARQKELKFDNFIIISKLLKAKDDQAIKKDKNKRSKQVDEHGLIYLNGEDEIFSNNALSKYEFEIADDNSDISVNENWKDGQQYTPYRKVILLNQDALTRSLDALAKQLNEK